MFQNSIKEILRAEFFPYTSETSLTEKLLEHGYVISGVKKKFGVLTFVATSDNSFIKTLVFGINIENKNMTVYAFNSSKTKLYQNYSIQMTYVSNIENELLDKVSNLFNYQWFQSKCTSFKSQLNYNGDNNFFLEFNDPFYFMLLSNFKGLNGFNKHKFVKFLEVSIQRVLINVHSVSMTELNGLTVAKKNLLKKKIILKLMKPFFYDNDERILKEQFVKALVKGNYFLGTYAYQILFESFKFNAEEYNHFFDEIRIEFKDLVEERLMNDIQQIDWNNVTAIGKIFNLYSSKQGIHLLQHKKILKENAFHLCILLQAMEDRFLNGQIFLNIIEDLPDSNLWEFAKLLNKGNAILLRNNSNRNNILDYPTYFPPEGENFISEERFLFLKSLFNIE